MNTYVYEVWTGEDVREVEVIAESESEAFEEVFNLYPDADEHKLVEAIEEDQ